MTEKLSIWEKLENIPLWILFICIFLSMAIITLYPLGIPIPIDQYSRDAYNTIESLDEGDIILMIPDVTAGGILYYGPGVIAIFKQSIVKGLKVIMYSGIADGPMMWERLADAIDPEGRGYVYGKDYVHLGYSAGYEPTYAAVLMDISNVFTVDYQNTPLSQLELMKEVTAPTYEKIDLIITVSGAPNMLKGWIRQGNVRYGIPVVSYLTETVFPGIVPFYPENTQGIINGGGGAAQYEILSGYPGTATRLTDVYSGTNAIILIFLILGNIGFFMNSRGK